MKYLRSIVSRIHSVATSQGGRGATTLASGMLVGQIVSFLATPLLARMYAPDDFGYLALVLSVVGIVAPISTLRFESALMLPKSPRNATALLALGATSAVAVTVIACIVLEALMRLGLADNLRPLPYFTLWVGLISLLTATFSLVTQFALRNHHYGAVAKRTLYQSIGTTGAQFAFRLLPTIPGLTIGYAFGRMAGILPLLTTIRGTLVPISRRDVSRMARRYWKFPAIFTPAAALNSGALAIPVLFVGSWYGVADAGQWGMAERIMAVPLALLGTAIGQVVEAQFATRLRDGHLPLARAYLNASYVLGTIAVGVSIALIIFPPLVLPWFLGGGWNEASTVMQLMTPMVAARIVANPMSKTLIVLEHAALMFAIDAARVVAAGITISILATMNGSLSDAASSISILFAFFYAVTWLTGLWATRRHDVRLLS